MIAALGVMERERKGAVPGGASPEGVKREVSGPVS